MRIYDVPFEDREKIKKRITDFLINRKEVLFAYIHGSFIENRPFRDVDVAIYVDGDYDLVYELEMEEELTRFVGLPIDVRVINDAPVMFRFKALGGELLFSKDENARCEFEEGTLREYHDYSYYLKRYGRDLLGI